MNIRCGNRKVHGNERADHESKAQVQLCFARPDGIPSIQEAWEEARQNDEAQGEYEAELRNERFFENRGADDGFEEWEARQGKVSYEEARAAAEAASRGYAETNAQVAGALSRIAGADDLDFTSVFEESIRKGRAAEAAAKQPFVPEDTPEMPWAPDPVVEAPLDGIYTVLHEDGGHRTLRLRTQDMDDKFMPGAQIISYLSGPNNERDYTGFGTTDRGQLKVWKKHQDNTELRDDALTLLAGTSGVVVESVHCARCHRKLTAPSSINRRLGTECAKK